MGLKLTDLIGKLKAVEIVGMSQAEKDGKQIVVLKVQDENGEHDIGLFGSDVAEKVLADHGDMDDGGKTLLDVPASKLKPKDEGIMWINNPY